MIQSIIIALLLSLSNTTCQWHEFYVSVTNLEINTDLCRATSRIFVDDLELAIRAQGNPNWVLSNETVNDSICTIYLENSISLEGEASGSVKWDSRSIEGEGPTRTLVLRYSARILSKGEIVYRSSVLTEVYREQINMVHLKIADERRSKNLDYLDASWELRGDE